MNTIFYLHIPKTGGQALAVRLASSFSPERVDILGPGFFFPQDEARFSRLLVEKSFIESHCSGLLPDAVETVDVLTTIREPAAQMASHYLQILRGPRSELQRAARTLSMSAFFVKFGDLLGNFQAGELMAAFYSRERRLDLDWAQPRTWSEKLAGILDRIRWVVPTESIDEFVTLWQLEMHRAVPYPSEVVNAAERDDQYGTLLDLCRETIERHCIDMVLWHAARRRFGDYREHTLRRLIPAAGVADASRCFWDGSAGIWLLRGWHAPTHAEPIGRHWWAGPESHSEVAFIRSETDRFLVFNIGVLCGIEPHDIWAITVDRRQRIPLSIEKLESGWRCWVDLSTLSLHSSIALCVPRVLAPLIVDPASSDSRRMSFATHDWGFANQCPVAIDLISGGERTAAPS